MRVKVRQARQPSRKPATLGSAISCSSRASWPFSSLARAWATGNHSTLSTSGKARICPEPLGHSSSKVLLCASAASRSPGTANAVTTLPPACLNGAKSMRGPAGGTEPTSSSNSRCAAAHGSSSCVYSPFGIDQAPSSLRAQNGPPGCAIRTSTTPSRIRYSSRPALSLGTSSHSDRALQILERGFQVTEQALQVRHTAPATDQTEVDVVRVVDHRDVQRLAV